MKIEKQNGLYRKRRVTAKSRVPLLIWLPVLLVVCAVLVAISMRTITLQNQQVPELNLARKHVWRVAVLGDIACEPTNGNFNDGNGVFAGCGQRAVGQALEREALDAVILVGDIQYPVGKFEDYERSFIPNFRDIKVPMYTVAGNHDYGNGTVQGGDLSGYKKAFDLYFPQMTYQKEGKTYYDFNLGPWKFYALDSNCEYIGGCAQGSAQYEWLTSKANYSAPVCSVGLWHHPVFTSGQHNEEKDTSRARALYEALQFAGTDVVLNGHDHHYERFAPKLADGTVSADGMREFVVGTGGYSLRKVNMPYVRGQEKMIDDSFGYLYLELYPGRYDWKFKNTYGDVLDAGSDSCRK